MVGGAACSRGIAVCVTLKPSTTYVAPKANKRGTVRPLPPKLKTLSPSTLIYFKIYESKYYKPYTLNPKSQKPQAL